MPQSDLRLFKSAAIDWPKSEIGRVPDNTRGIYFLYNEEDGFKNVVYVGIARGVRTGIRGRLKTHFRSKTKQWTHFSAYEVHDNISKAEVEEIEALFLTAYANDQHANSLNVQRGNKKLRSIRDRTKREWK